MLTIIRFGSLNVFYSFSRLYGRTEVTGPRDPRTWILRRIAGFAQGTSVVTGAPADFCAGLPHSSRCRMVPIADAAVFEASGAEAIALLR